MTKKILLTGSNGLLGQKITNQIISSHPEVDLLATSRGVNRHPNSLDFTYRGLDLLDEEKVFQVIEEFQPDSIIHTAAMTQVDLCEDKKEMCDAINIGTVRTLAKACERFNVHLVHISTDFVFNGEEGPYKEDAQPDPVNYYGHSKWKAEQVLVESPVSSAILRTILLYGITPAMSRSNIVLWVKGSLEQAKPIRVVNDQYRNPTLVEDLADASIQAALRKAEGIYHISGPEGMWIVDIARRVADYFGLDKRLISETDSASLGQKAKRPPKTGFIIDKAQRDLGFSPRVLEEGLALLQQQMLVLDSGV
ncbi:MAG: SDR family oxidoreductase [Bacteroidota bacterium]